MAETPPSSRGGLERVHLSDTSTAALTSLNRGTSVQALRSVYDVDLIDSVRASDSMDEMLKFAAVVAQQKK